MVWMMGPLGSGPSFASQLPSGLEKTIFLGLSVLSCEIKCLEQVIWFRSPGFHASRPVSLHHSTIVCTNQPRSRLSGVTAKGKTSHLLTVPVLQCTVPGAIISLNLSCDRRLGEVRAQVCTELLSLSKSVPSCFGVFAMTQSQGGQAVGHGYQSWWMWPGAAWVSDPKSIRASIRDAGRSNVTGSS